METTPSKPKSKAKVQAELESQPNMVDKVSFTGIARTMVCHDHMGQFRNFRNVKLTIVDGIVTKMEMTDPYASFEAISRLDLDMHMASLELNDNWKDGKAWTS